MENGLMAHALPHLCHRGPFGYAECWRSSNGNGAGLLNLKEFHAEKGVQAPAAALQGGAERPSFENGKGACFLPLPPPPSTSLRLLSPPFVSYVIYSPFCVRLVGV